mgnify:CR=1 FL=1
MKKLFIFAALAALAMTACTKTEFKAAQDNLITFQAANYVPQKTKVTGTEFPKTETFGTYAWTDGMTGEFFINNVEVSFNSELGAWTPATTYYWPKNQTVDFFIACNPFVCRCCQKRKDPQQA